jgi:SHS2 domain-containing protein
MDASEPLPRSRHAFEEHTGELKLRLEASTAARLFEDAGRALAELMGGERRSHECDIEETVALTSADREALLVDWLNELILRAEVGHVLFGEFHVDRVSDRELNATVLGWRVERLRNPVKAATFHEVAVREAKGGYEATVILDV